MPSLADGLVLLLAVLDKMEIAYQIGGSLASSSYGEFRSTNDVDVVARLDQNQVAEFAELLQASGFYADPDTMRAAFITC